jgi:SAM-dependent methyltransferase
VETDTDYARLRVGALGRLRRVLGRARRLGRPVLPGDEAYRGQWNAAARADALSAILAPPGGRTTADHFEAMGRLDADWLREFVSAGSVVLDVGCGIGRIETYLAPHCARMCGVDVSDEMVRAARRRTAGIANVEFYRTSATDLSVFPDGTFDFVFSYLVLQHLEYEDAFRALREIARVLKPTGLAVLQFPSLAAPTYACEFVRRAETGARHAVRVRVYTPDLATRLLALAGLKVERIEPHPGGTLTQDEIVTVLRRQPDRPVISNFRIRPLTPEVTDATVRWLISATVARGSGLREARAEVALVATGQTFGVEIRQADLDGDTLRVELHLTGPPPGRNHGVFCLVDAAGERSNEIPFYLTIEGTRSGPKGRIAGSLERAVGVDD